MQTPRVTRNFWIEAVVDGRAAPIRFGPAGRSGEVSLNIFIRDEGGINPIAMRIRGYTYETGRLVLEASIDGAGEPLRLVSKR